MKIVTNSRTKTVKRGESKVKVCDKKKRQEMFSVIMFLDTYPAIHRNLLSFAMAFHI
jgi:hypothetical protein